jgi:3',5'-cyclic-AMP phosphodiesterase
VARPFLLVQLSDPHIGADWGEGDPLANLAAIVDAVRALDPKPDAVLVSGDLADHAADAEYEQVRELVARVEAPTYVLPGNHDERAALRRHFDVPGVNGRPVQYPADLGPLRLVVLDSTRPGEDPGELDGERLSWLEETLAERPETPTVLAQHHPPLRTGAAAFDDVGLPPTDQQALAAVVARHPQVLRILAGHLHRTAFGELGGRQVLVAPSTYVQLHLDFGTGEAGLTGEPPGFAVHAFVEGELVSHVRAVR